MGQSYLRAGRRLDVHAGLPDRPARAQLPDAGPVDRSDPDDGGRRAPPTGAHRPHRRHRSRLHGTGRPQDRLPVQRLRPPGRHGGTRRSGHRGEARRVRLESGHGLPTGGRRPGFHRPREDPRQAGRRRSPRRQGDASPGVRPGARHRRRARAGGDHSARPQLRAGPVQTHSGVARKVPRHRARERARASLYRQSAADYRRIPRVPLPARSARRHRPDHRARPLGVCVDQLVPAESVTDGALYFYQPSCRQLGNALDQHIPGDCPQVIAISNTRRREPVPLAKRHFDRNVADCGGDLGHDELIQVAVTVIARQQQYRPAAGWLGQIGPPDLELFQGSNFSQFDQESASEGESGCLRYASLMSAYSRFRMASLTAVRMNSVRFRLAAAGATWFKALYVASSSWTRMDRIWIALYQIAIYRCRRNIEEPPPLPTASPATALSPTSARPESHPGTEGPRSADRRGELGDAIAQHRWGWCRRIPARKPFAHNKMRGLRTSSLMPVPSNLERRRHPQKNISKIFSQNTRQTYL